MGTGSNHEGDCTDRLEQAQMGRASAETRSNEMPLDGSMRCYVPDCPEPHRLQLGGGMTGAVNLPVLAPHTQSGVWSLLNPLWRGLRQAWSFTREVSGDDAYDRYLDHMAQAHPAQIPMTRSRYHRFRMEQKWNRISRCC